MSMYNEIERLFLFFAKDNNNIEQKKINPKSPILTAPADDNNFEKKKTIIF